MAGASRPLVQLYLAGVEMNDFSSTPTAKSTPATAWYLGSGEACRALYSNVASPPVPNRANILSSRSSFYHPL